jgi:DNA modification methylase
MVAVFREVRRVLRADGTLWLNCGDSYFGGGYANHAVNGETWLEEHGGDRRRSRQQDRINANPSLKPKDLVGIPWRLAFALQADGWYLRSDIIWAKPNPMPESVTDRPTKAHEYVFLLSKSPRYFFDQEAVREPHGSEWIGRAPVYDLKLNGDRNDGGAMATTGSLSGRNIRSVWDIATQPYPEAHFATFPEELVRRCVLAGTSERGCCPVCGAPWEREIEIVKERPHSELRGKFGDDSLHPRFSRGFGGGASTIGLSNSHNGANEKQSQTLGWRPSCTHNQPPVPCTVLDPFMGSGTTGLVARKHGRRSIGIELNAGYCELASRRLAQQSLLTEQHEPLPPVRAARGLTGGAYHPPGQSPHSNARGV